jgi:hypothetical protein
MADTLYDYDTARYDRRFMNCAERHAVVFLKARHPDVDQLFCQALVSSDEILRQIVCDKTPKYNFDNGCFTPEALGALGINQHELRSDTFNEVQPQVDALIEQQGFVLISGSVFYFPHCPEYRTSHLHHLVVLAGVDSREGRYQVVDDNAASVLCHYRYDHHQVADFYENNGDRRVRYFTLTPGEPGRAAAWATARFRHHIGHYQDSQAFFTTLGEYLASPFESDTVRLRVLHDAFSLLSGSRLLFGHYLQQAGAAEAAAQAFAIGQEAFILKSLVVKAQIIGHSDHAVFRARAERVRQQETALLHACRTLTGE